MSAAIRSMRPEDWPAVRVVYEEGIASGTATFETSAPGWDEWDAGHLKSCRLTAWLDGTLVGFAALSPVSRRSAYAGVAEVSVYVAKQARGQGIGRQLLEALVVESETARLWTLQASIFAENHASQKLHRSCGFRLVGRRDRIAQRDGIWHDTVIYERRSTNV